MNCKQCGGVNPPEAKVCRFCGSELEEKEKVYVRYSSDVEKEQNKTLNSEAGKAFVLGLMSLVFGLVILRSIFAILSLISADKAKKLAEEYAVPLPPNARAGKILSVISLVIAAAAAVGFIIVTAVKLTTRSYYSYY